MYISIFYIHILAGLEPEAWGSKEFLGAHSDLARRRVANQTFRVEDCNEHDPCLPQGYLKGSSRGDI